MTTEAMVREFHAAKQVHFSWMPDHPTADIPSGLAHLRQVLLDEEVAELHHAVRADDLIETADALGDIAYVLGGTAVTYGLPFPVTFTCPDGRPDRIPRGVPYFIRMLLLENIDYAAGELRTATGAADPGAIGLSILHFTRILDDIAILYGIDLGAVFEAIHISNMTKDNTPEAGKLIKGPGYRPPDIARALGLKEAPPLGVYGADVAAGRYEAGDRK
jgi:predicted HAD superfamily Cof-like phosphohydrolase